MTLLDPSTVPPILVYSIYLTGLGSIAIIGMAVKELIVAVRVKLTEKKNGNGNNGNGGESAFKAQVICLLENTSKILESMAKRDEDFQKMLITLVDVAKGHEITLSEVQKTLQSHNDLTQKFLIEHQRGFILTEQIHSAIMKGSIMTKRRRRLRE